MRAWALLLCLVHCLLVQPGANGKRFDPSMVDPLMRRSSLDKNFMRFGRSSPSFTEEVESEDSHDSSPGAETNKEENFLRSMRGKDNFIRFGRGKQDNYMRFGRGKQDNYMRFGRGKQDNYMRFGRGKQDNYMRFGRGKQDNYMRFGRGKQDNFMRFGRGKQDNYMRFGRGKQDNFIRFGRGKQDNFMRFGRDFEGLTNVLPDIFEKTKTEEGNINRESRGKQDNFMRFGKSIADSENDIPIAMRSGNSKGNSNFIRFGRSKQDSFIRFGKSGSEKDVMPFGDDLDEQKDKPKGNSNFPISLGDDFTRETKSKDLNLIRFGRQPPNKNDGFIRFGRGLEDQTEESSPDSELIPQRLKRSVLNSFDSVDEVYPSKIEDSYDHVSLPFFSLPDDLEEEYSAPMHQEDYASRRKRSLSFQSSTPAPVTEEDTSVDYISAKIRLDSSSEPEYRSSLLSAGIPNVIVGPEFSLLPDLDPPSTMLKRGRPGDQNFLRLG